MPSPTSTIVPTPLTSAPSSKPLISLLMIEVISSDRIAIGSLSLDGGQPGTQPLEAAPHACVNQSVSDPHGNPADQRLVDDLVHLDTVARERSQPLLDRGPLLRFELDRGSHLRQRYAALASQ